MASYFDAGVFANALAAMPPGLTIVVHETSKLDVVDRDGSPVGFINPWTGKFYAWDQEARNA